MIDKPRKWLDNWTFKHGKTGGESIPFLVAEMYRDAIEAFATECHAEAIRLWRIAVCPPENIEELQAEVSALGTATPEACRAIDAMNRRLDKLKFIARVRDLEQMLRTAQDAATIAILELQEWREATGFQTPGEFSGYAAEVRAQFAENDGVQIEVATNSGEAKL